MIGTPEQRERLVRKAKGRRGVMRRAGRTLLRSYSMATPDGGRIGCYQLGDHMIGIHTLVHEPALKRGGWFFWRRWPIRKGGE